MSGGINYNGVVVTSIKVENIGGDKVQFDGSSVTGSEAIFVKDVKETAKGSKKFTATKINTDEAKTLINEMGSIDIDTTPLFCVHGYSVEPHDMLQGMASKLKAFEDEKHYYPIPVLWPCDSELRWGNDKQRSYEWDQEVFSQKAGNVLNQFVKTIPDNTFPRKSLMMHSMGNHVVFNGACGFSDAPQVQFENIFMVSADVPFDIFHKKPSNSYVGSNGKVYKNKEKKATNFFKMLKRTSTGAPKGKIYYLHHLDDNALYWSSQLNWECRVGQRGIGKYKWTFNQSWYEDPDLVREEIKDHYENYDVAKKVGKMSDKKHKHSYQFDDFAIKYYAEKAFKS